MTRNGASAWLAIWSLCTTTGRRSGRFDFSELNAQSFLSRGARDPQAQSAGDEQRRQENSENAGDKQRAAKKEEKFLEPHLRPNALAGNETR